MKGGAKMKKNNRDISLFRFSIIAPIINNTHGFSTKKAYMEKNTNSPQVVFIDG